jgi:hypothetical protein
VNAILPAISVGLTVAAIAFLTFGGRVRRNV